MAVSESERDVERLSKALGEITVAIAEAEERCKTNPMTCSAWHSFALGQAASIAEAAKKRKMW